MREKKEKRKGRREKKIEKNGESRRGRENVRKRERE